MIRNIIATAILFATLVSLTLVTQVASAVEPALNLEISAFRDNLATSSHSNAHPFSWTPDISQQERIIKMYERLVLPQAVDSNVFSGYVSETVASEQRLYSFEVYQGDGLDDLRQRSKHYNSITLPDEDTEAYGVSVTQRF